MNPNPALSLPRPNPGPEPWPIGWSQLLAIGINILTVLAIVLAAWACFRRPRRGRFVIAAKPDAVGFTSSWQGLTDRLREGLIARFGPRLGTMTTEEIARNSALHDALDLRRRGELIAFLDASDRARFRAQDEDLTPWIRWLDPFLKELQDQRGGTASDSSDGGGAAFTST